MRNQSKLEIYPKKSVPLEMYFQRSESLNAIYLSLFLENFLFLPFEIQRSL